MLSLGLSARNQGDTWYLASLEKNFVPFSAGTTTQQYLIVLLLSRDPTHKKDLSVNMQVWSLAHL